MYFVFSKLINVLQMHIKNAINNKTPDNEFESIGSLGEKSSEKHLYKTTKHLQYIMKFIIRSRILFSNLNDDKDQLIFKARLEGDLKKNLNKTKNLSFVFALDLLASFIKLIACPNDLLRSQGAMLKYIHIIASDLMQVYDPISLRSVLNKKNYFLCLNICKYFFSKYIVEIIRQIPQGRLTQSKMICIKDMVDTKLFKLPECRAILLPVFCEQIRDKLECKEEVCVLFFL